MSETSPPRRTLLIKGDSDYCQHTVHGLLAVWKPAAVIWLTDVSQLTQGDRKSVV